MNGHVDELHPLHGHHPFVEDVQTPQANLPVIHHQNRFLPNAPVHHPLSVILEEEAGEEESDDEEMVADGGELGVQEEDVGEQEDQEEDDDEEELDVGLDGGHQGVEQADQEEEDVNGGVESSEEEVYEYGVVEFLEVDGEAVEQEIGEQLPQPVQEHPPLGTNKIWIWLTKGIKYAGAVVIAVLFFGFILLLGYSDSHVPFYTHNATLSNFSFSAKQASLSLSFSVTLTSSLEKHSLGTYRNMKIKTGVRGVFQLYIEPRTLLPPAHSTTKDVSWFVDANIQRRLNPTEANSLFPIVFQIFIFNICDCHLVQKGKTTLDLTITNVEDEDLENTVCPMEITLTDHKVIKCLPCSK